MSAGICLELASEHEVRTGGAGWDIVYGFAESPFGYCLAGECPRGLCHLSFVDRDAFDEAENGLRKSWSGARFRRDDTCARKFTAPFWDQDRKRSEGAPLKLLVRGTAFQVRVWKALLQIEPGRVVSYGELAAITGNPAASRAVGTAVGSNAIAYLIPCHRVVRTDGTPGGYRWGCERKKAMLAKEGIR